MAGHHGEAILSPHEHRSIIHDFQERLEYSASLSDEPSWVEFYRRLWPEALSIIRVDTDSRWQRCGVDRMILLPGMKQVLVDEKKRTKDYGDLLIEEWSVGHYENGDRYAGKKIGWSLDQDKQCDYVAYAILPVSRCYLLPYELLRITCLYNLARWKTLKGGDGRPAYPRDSPNAGYWTRNVAVTWPELKRCLEEQMLRRFGADLALPVPASQGNQLIFEWPCPTA